MPGSNRSTSLGDCPEDILDAAVVSDRIVSTVDVSLNKLVVLSIDLGSKTSGPGCERGGIVYITGGTLYKSAADDSDGSRKGGFETGKVYVCGERE